MTADFEPGPIASGHAPVNGIRMYYEVHGSGASVALQVAIRHPERVRKLVFASAMTRRDGARPELWEFMEQAIRS